MTNGLGLLLFISLLIIIPEHIYPSNKSHIITVTGLHSLPCDLELRQSSKTFLS